MATNPEVVTGLSDADIGALEQDAANALRQLGLRAQPRQVAILKTQRELRLALERQRHRVQDRGFLGQRRGRRGHGKRAGVAARDGAVHEVGRGLHDRIHGRLVDGPGIVVVVQGQDARDAEPVFQVGLRQVGHQRNPT